MTADFRRQGTWKLSPRDQSDRPASDLTSTSGIAVEACGRYGPPEGTVITECEHDWQPDQSYHMTCARCTKCKYAVTVGTRATCEILTERDNARARIRELEVALRDTVDALVWCSGSYDFAPTGRASVGWGRVAQPAIDKAAVLLAVKS